MISDVLPFGRLWYGEPNALSNAIGYAKFRSRSHNAVIRVYDEAGNVLETHDHAGDFKEWRAFTRITSHFQLRANIQCFCFHRAIARDASGLYGKITSIYR